LGDSGKKFVIFATIVAAIMIGVGQGSNLAYAANGGPTTSVESLGVLQIAAHDLFNVNRCMDEDRMLITDGSCTVDDFEDGELNLSTLLVDTANGDVPFSCTGDGDILMGGEPRNRETIGIATASSQLGHIYCYFEETYDSEFAYEKTLSIYHKAIKKEFQRTFKHDFPAPQPGDVGHEHNLALRSLHDFAPGTVKFDGENRLIFELQGELFDSRNEMRQPTSVLDGQLDVEFTGITTCIPNTDPEICIEVDLLLADQDFGVQFLGDTPGCEATKTCTFDYHLRELEDGEYNEDDDVTKLIIELFARGLEFP